MPATGVISVVVPLRNAWNRTVCGVVMCVQPRPITPQVRIRPTVQNLLTVTTVSGKPIKAVTGAVGVR